MHPQTGFLYVANSAGVLEFDGVRWRLIRMPHGGSARTVLVATNGFVWAAGSGSVAVLEPGNPAAGEPVGELIARDISPRLPPAVLASTSDAPPTAAGATGDEPDAPVSGLATLVGATPILLEAPDGVYLRLRRYIVRFGPDGRVEAWETPPTINRLWWHDGAVHATVVGLGVHRLDGGQLQPVAIPGDPRLLDTSPRPDGAWLWLTTKGPWQVRGHSAAPLGSATARAFLAGEVVYDAIVLPDGGFAYATSRHGLVLLDREGEIAEIVDRTRGLPSDRVNGVALDGEGGLWLAQHNGMVRVQRESALASHGLAQGLPGSPRAFAIAGERFFVAHSEGLARRDRTSGRFEAVRGFAGGINQVASVGDSVLATGAGLWALAPGGGTAVLSSDTATRYGISPGRTESDTAYVSGTLNLGLARRNPSADATPWSMAFYFRNMPTGANAFFDDGAGLLWVASRSDGKIRRLDLRGGVRAEAPVTTFGPDEGLPPMKDVDKVRLLKTGGTFFVVSRRGAWRWDAARARFAPEPRLMREGAGPDAIGGSPAAGWIYFPTPTPLLRRVIVSAAGAVTVEDHDVPALGGLVINTLLPFESQHTLWLAGQGMLVSLDLDWQPPRPAAPLATMLRRVVTSEGATLWAAPAFAAPARSTALTLDPAQRGVRIEFTAPSFQSDLQARAPLRFRTRAAPIDRDWTPWSEEPHRDLTNLPDGTVAFEVQARDATGRLSPATRLDLRLPPPWWRTTTARVGWGALGLALVSGLVWARTRALRQRNAHLESVVAARTAELARLRQIDRDESAASKLAEEKTRLEMLRYQLNPHFLYNALNSIRALIFSRPPAAGDMVLQLADLCRVTLTRNEDLAPVSEEFAMLKLYLDMEKTRWRDKLTVEIDLAPDAAAQPIPPFLLLPLVENALKHGRQSTTGVMHLRLSARLVAPPTPLSPSLLLPPPASAPPTLLLAVANTGTWLEPGQSLAPSTGIGLENLRQRLRRYYPQAHEFTVAQDGDRVVARVRLTGAVPASSVAAPI